MYKFKTNSLIEQRLEEFKRFETLESSEWFSELCFCILTANSKAETAINIQQEIQATGFINLSLNEIATVIRKNKHRFHNTKARYIIEARKFVNIKNQLKQHSSGPEAREFIVKNIKGLGYKEASHFLRNVGYDDVAIIDRHILRYMHQNRLIDLIPKQLSKQIYFEFEGILIKMNPNLARLDLIIWQQMTGKVLK